MLQTNTNRKHTGYWGASRRTTLVARMRQALRRPARNLRDGFSLLETTIAIAILGVGIIGVMASTLSATKMERKSRSLTQAMYLAEQQLEAFRLMPEADVLAMMGATGYPDDPAGAIDPDPGDGDHISFYRRFIIEPDTPDPGIFTFTIEVDWTDPSGTPRTTELRSMVAAQ